MDFIGSTDGKDGVEKMARSIAAGLKAGKVLWLICGGSNIPLSKLAMDIVRASTLDIELKNLTLGLTDERYGIVGHKDSNWQQLIQAGFNFDSIETLPVLTGKPLQETVSDYAKKLGEAFKQSQFVVAQFGIGSDGHIAGMLPHTAGIHSSGLVCGYESAPYVRITITPPAFLHIDEAYAFVFGASKHEAVTRLWQKDLTIDEMPCQILKRIQECRFYSDQL